MFYEKYINFVYTHFFQYNLICMVFIDTKLLENNNLAMTGLEPAILDFGKPMPFPFGQI